MTCILSAKLLAADDSSRLPYSIRPTRSPESLPCLHPSLPSTNHSFPASARSSKPNLNLCPCHLPSLAQPLFLFSPLEISPQNLITPVPTLRAFRICDLRHYLPKRALRIGIRSALDTIAITYSNRAVVGNGSFPIIIHALSS